MSASKRFCPQCGKENSPGARFCKECGAAFELSPRTGWWSRQTRRVKITLIIAPLLLVGLIVGLAVGLTGGPNGPDLGKASYVDGNPDLVVYTDNYGAGPADQVILLMAEGSGRPEAEAAALQIGGAIVGEVEYIQLYQVQTAGTTAEDLASAIETAAAQPGVEAAFSNGIQSGRAVGGNSCSPLRDPVYDGANAVPYEMIGLQQAWDIVRASGIRLQDVHIGMVDSAVYTDSGRGFSTELYFPDAGGNYPAGKAQFGALSADATTDVLDPEMPAGLTHGTMVAHMMAADAEGGGVVGVLGPYGENLTMTTGNYETGQYVYEAPAPDPNDVTQYHGFFLKPLVLLKEEVEAGATVINMSFGAAKLGPENAAEDAAFRRFFEQMDRDHPEVLFVVAAGNTNEALDGTNDSTGGKNLPNVMTVGALDSEGDRADKYDWTTEEIREDWYQQLKAEGKLNPPGMTYEEFVEWLPVGSNYATGNGEVTLSVCGTQVPVGVDADGKPVLEDGTSFSAPQVAAAAALLQSLDPSLEAWEIKQILVETGDSEVLQPDGTRIQVPANVGGKLMRMDKAVLKVINRLLGPGNELIYGDLIELATIELTAEEHEFGYLITATTPRVETPSGIDLRITVEGEAEIFGEETHRIYSNLETGTWTVAPGPDAVKVKVERLDNGACAFLELPGTGETTETTASSSTATTEKAGGGQWVMSGSPVVNPDGLPLEFYGGGATPGWFGETRFEGKWLKYSPGATSFTVNEREVDHEFEYFNVTIDCVFDAPPAVLVPGETYELTVNCSSSGSVVEGNPGVQFWYSSDDVTVSPDAVLAYYPWGAGFDGTSSKTYSFTVPEGSSGDTLEISASLWNAGQCWVIWTYTVE